MGTQGKSLSHPNNPCTVQTTEWPIRLCGANLMFSSHLPACCLTNMSLSSSNSSPSCPGHFNVQYFYHVFPVALPHCQRNVLYATVLQQPSLVANIERQSSYEEDNSLQSLICVFHHLCSTQIYLGSFEPCTDHIVSSTLYIASALDNTLDLLHDHGFHYHILALPPRDITLARVFQPIYCTLSIVE